MSSRIHPRYGTGAAYALPTSTVADPGPPRKRSRRQLNISSETEAGALVISLHGELDMASAPKLDQHLRNAETSTLRRLVIDLRKLEFMDSAGLRTLLFAQERADTNGQQLSLRRGPYAVQRVLDVTRTIDRFSFDE